MTEDEARFALLQLEMTSIQAGIRATDTILFQIKGWCVTTTVALAGFSITSDEATLLWMTVPTIIVFWLVDSYFKSIQRVYIRRDNVIEAALSTRTVAEALADRHELGVPGLASTFRTSRLADELRATWREAYLPITYAVYAFLLMLVGFGALLTLAFDK